VGALGEEIREKMYKLKAQYKSPKYIVMSESIYSAFRFEVNLNMGIEIGEFKDITEYMGLEIIRLDLPWKEDVLLVG
jgi:hypothetical protein